MPRSHGQLLGDEQISSGPEQIKGAIRVLRGREGRRKGKRKGAREQEVGDVLTAQNRAGPARVAQVDYDWPQV